MNFRKSLIPQIFFAADDGAGAGGGGDAAGAGGGGQSGGQAGSQGGGDAGGAGGGQGGGQAGGQAGAQSGGDSVYRFEGLPDHLLGKDAADTLGKVAKAYQGAREFMSKFGEIPKDVAGYAFEPTEKLKPYTEGFKDDPFFNTTKEVFLKNGLSTKHFQGVLTDLMEAMVDKGIVGDPIDVNKERAEIAPDVTDPKERNARVDQIVRENQALIDAWKEQGLDEKVATFLKANLDRAAANKLVDFIRESRGEQRPALGGQLQTRGGVTEADLDKRSADPRNTLGDPKYDRAFAQETDRMYRQFYGD